MKTSHIKLLLDIGMTVAVLALMEPRATGLSLHEWGGLAIAVAFLAHIVLNWTWISCMTGNFLKRATAKNRINYILDALLLLGFFTILLSGAAIAKTIDFSWLALPGTRFFWRSVHISASLLTLIGVGVHVGLHWKWVVCRFRKTRKQELAHA